MKYYKVQVLLGHVGRGRGLPAWLYIEAKNLLKAMDSAKKFPGVKHSRMPNQAIEISYEEYLEGREESDYKAKMTQIFNCVEEANGNGVD